MSLLKYRRWSQNLFYLAVSVCFVFKETLPSVMIMSAVRQCWPHPDLLLKKVLPEAEYDHCEHILWHFFSNSLWRNFIESQMADILKAQSQNVGE